MDVTVVVPVTGADWWDLAEQRALPSAMATSAPWVVVGSEATVASARNAGLAGVLTDWVCFLDADDALPANYFDVLPADPRADVIVTSIQYYVGPSPARLTPRGMPGLPSVAGHGHGCAAPCLVEGNWVHIGAIVRTEAVRAVGGFREFEWSEDWDLWLRLHLAGRRFTHCRDAVYQAWSRPNSRNRSGRAIADRVHHEILRANGLES